jgi:hypothetical protein
MNEKAPSLVISIATIVITDLQKDYPGWQRAFIRFHATDDHWAQRDHIKRTKPPNIAKQPTAL